MVHSLPPFQLSSGRVRKNDPAFCGHQQHKAIGLWRLILQFSSSTALLLHQLPSPLTRVHALNLQNHHQKHCYAYRLGPDSCLSHYPETIKVLPQEECDLSCIYHSFRSTPLNVCHTIKSSVSHEGDMPSRNCFCPEGILGLRGRHLRGKTLILTAQSPSPLEHCCGSLQLKRAAPERAPVERHLPSRLTPPSITSGTRPSRPAPLHSPLRGKTLPRAAFAAGACLLPPLALTRLLRVPSPPESTTAPGRGPQPRPSFPSQPPSRPRPAQAYLRWSKEWMLRAAFPCPPPTQLRERPNMLTADVSRACGV